MSTIRSLFDEALLIALPTELTARTCNCFSTTLFIIA
ncbi:hypothetical protein J2Z26_003729 [Bacillus luteolus]|nr:hypothetical protein [Cytobacillus luteolus]